MIRVAAGTEPRGASVELLLGTACGALIACLYYAQPVAALIGASLQIPVASIGLLVTLPLVGYGVGLVTVVPLGDLTENRRLVLIQVGLEVACMLVMSAAQGAELFYAAAFCAGITASAVQILVPYATYIFAEPERSRAVARVVSGIMLGIMLARPLSGLITDRFGWRAVFETSAAAMLMLLVALALALPVRQPASGLTYGRLVASLASIFLSTAPLRRRAFYHACMFGSFTVFWTGVPLLLAGTAYGLSQRQIAWVALAGVAGAVAPPFATRLVDRGRGRAGTVGAMALASAAFALSSLAPTHSRGGVLLIAVVAILLDFAVSANLVFGQRVIFSLAPEIRSRLNGLYIAIFFIGGAIGSVLSGWLYPNFGWLGVVALGATLPLVALLAFSVELFQSSWKARASTV